MSDALYDVRPEQYPTVIREMIRHENDVTNHRIMWLLIVQGLIANAYVSAAGATADIVTMLAPVGILVTFSAFVLLYKSYQARGYLHFLGNEAKRGTLREEYLPLAGWPKKRIKGWRRKAWVCPWLGQASDLLEPYLFLPSLLILAWLVVLLGHWLKLRTSILLLLAVILVAVIMSTFCLLWVWSQMKDEEEQWSEAHNGRTEGHLKAQA
jgi:hypothetical protein